ncbi:MAG: 30S ribosomal protein S5 [Limisphaerales bacterium]
MAEEENKTPEAAPAETPAPAPEAAAPAAPAPAAPAAPAPAAPAASNNSGGGGGGGGYGGGGNRGFGGRGGNNRGPGGRPGGNRQRREREPLRDANGDELSEKVLFINRSSKVVKGGRRFSFSALVVTGNKKGKVGLGLGKANEVADCIRKAGENSRATMKLFSVAGNTIPHEIYSVYDGARVILRPASKGTGIIAGKTVRAILEAAGLKDVLSKSLGSNNAANLAKATLQALDRCRTRDQIRELRGQDPIANTNGAPAAAKEEEAAEPAAA